MQLGENQGMRMRGATVACFVAFSSPDTSGGPASYAAHAAAYAPRGYRLELPADPRQGLDMSLLFEADVMELPVRGAVFTPRHSCFDFATDDQPFWHPELDGFVSTSAKTVRKIPVRYGRGLKQVTARSNRLIPSPKKESIKRMPSHAFMRDAFRDPKAELLHLIEMAGKHTCSQQCSNHSCGCLFEELNCSMQDIEEAFLALYERPCTAAEQSFAQFMWLWKVIESHLQATGDQEATLGWPFVLSPSIASVGKNSRYAVGIGQSDPFKTQNESESPDVLDMFHDVYGCICNR